MNETLSFFGASASYLIGIIAALGVGVLALVGLAVASNTGLLQRAEDKLLGADEARGDLESWNAALIPLGLVPGRTSISLPGLSGDIGEWSVYVDVREEHVRERRTQQIVRTYHVTQLRLLAQSARCRVPFKLSRQTLVDTLSMTPELEVGHSDFDRAFLVEAPDVPEARALLSDPRVIAALLPLAEARDVELHPDRLKLIFEDYAEAEVARRRVAAALHAMDTLMEVVAERGLLDRRHIARDDPAEAW